MSAVEVEVPLSTEIVRLVCPMCRGPVYAPADSDREQVDCTAPGCDVRLRTRRNLDGSIGLVDRGSRDVLEAGIARLDEGMAASDPNWKASVRAAVAATRARRRR